jgi:hypothetical protein
MGTDSPMTFFIPVHCEPKKAPCPKCGKHGRHKKRGHRSKEAAAGRRRLKVHTLDERDGAALPAKRASTASTSQEHTGSAFATGRFPPHLVFD